MIVTKTIPAASLSALDLRRGDTLRVIEMKGEDLVLEINREEDLCPRIPGAATEWVRSSTGIVKLEEGETADDVRMAYYIQKHGPLP